MNCLGWSLGCFLFSRFVWVTAVSILFCVSAVAFSTVLIGSLRFFLGPVRIYLPPSLLLLLSFSFSASMFTCPSLWLFANQDLRLPSSFLRSRSFSSLLCIPPPSPYFIRLLDMSPYRELLDFSQHLANYLHLEQCRLLLKHGGSWTATTRVRSLTADICL